MRPITSNRVIDVTFTEGSVTEPVSLDAVKAYMRVDYTNDDALITSMINEARVWVEKRCSLSLVERSVSAVVEVVNRIELPYGPVTGPVVVKDKNGDDVASPTLIGDKHPRLEGCGRFTATYNAGFAEVPESLRLAIMAKVAADYENRGDSPASGYGAIAEKLSDPFKRITWL